MTDPRQQAAAEVSAALAPLSRRRFLKAALWGTAGVSAVLVGGVALLRRSPRDALPVPADLAYLSAAQYRLFQRLAEVLLPTAGTPLFPAAEVPVARHVDAILGTLTAEVRTQLGVGLALFDNAAVAGHWKRFVDLDETTALAYVNDWLNAPSETKRALGFVVSKLTHTGYWLDARTWPAIEFDGAVTRKWGIPSRGNQPLPA